VRAGKLGQTGWGKYSDGIYAKRVVSSFRIPFTPPKISGMYSASWFEAFTARVEEPSSLEVRAIIRLCSPDEWPRLLEIGCGTGRVSGPLAAAGYRVVGIDINEGALRRAREQAPGPHYICLDQRDVGSLRDPFDAAIILWNSLGFASRSDDEAMLADVRGILRSGGKLLLDLYHPTWLAAQPIETTTADGVVVRRWVEHDQCFHEIRYPNHHVDQISFHVYLPGEMISMLERVGYRVESQMTWWDSTRPSDSSQARYQLECVRL
jgi:SAM-dependent methyltransferase